MNIIQSPAPNEMGQKAAELGAQKLKAAIAANGRANMILATGASQFETINALLAQDIDWAKVTMFHLDEYIGIDETHPASFKKYLKERFVSQVPGLKAAHYVVPDAADPQKTCDDLGTVIAAHPIDVCFAGIGENCHLAFNDPPADFETEKAFIIVHLDEACRQQQLGEGWFSTLNDVPKRAISMSIRQIMKSKTIILSIPDQRKAEAVKNMIRQDVSPLYPATIVQDHADVHIFIDDAAGSLL